MPLAAEVVVMREGSVTTTASERLCNTFHKPKPDSEHGWVEGLKALFEEEGLVDVSRTRHTWPNYLRPLWSQSSMTATADVMAKIDAYNTKGTGMGMKFVEDLERESANGVAVNTSFQCVVGRKML
ncbi:uncharacterized protein EAE97_004439 [Botrytis byssoidea]|uniref:Uncharacterized protein n=1 Tax=Botrytis byssoidea TaxID=139641 RepID=A0A9P5IPZ6_9HELO|nr:uncharacterized protein EAE97_004439 [Botrytis byssoidea]KAF7947190.1 hypothetical protein EAE97_004439 [Botrytis byssoidea]